MLDEGIPLGIARAVLQGETDALRFERFCVDFVSEVEGKTKLVTTSRSWDRGRDGHSVGPGPRIVVCASLTPGVQKKAASDLAKCAKSGVPVDKVYFCTTQDPSEATLDAIAATLPFKKVEVEGMTANKIAQLCGHYPEPMRRHYPTELRDLLEALVADHSAKGNEREALLLALATAGHPDSSSVRDATYELIIRRALRDRVARTSNELSKEIGNRLRLARPLSFGALKPHLNMLEHTGMIKENNGKYIITEHGAAAVNDDTESAERVLTEGRLKIRQAIEASLGSPLKDQQFDCMWKSIEKTLTNFFYAQGLQMVQAIGKLFGDAEGGLKSEIDYDQETVDYDDGYEIEGDEDDEGVASKRPKKRGVVPFFVNELAKSATEASSNTEHQKEIKRAIRDIFADRNGPAYESIGSVCATFVIACMLGLEAHSGQRLRIAIASTHLILDTDIVLDYLGEGEPEHESAEQLVVEWQKLGGTIHLATPVAEEVAHHAWIAENDYKETRQFLRSETDRRALVKNVFARAFGYLSETQKGHPSSWKPYISQFRGSSNDDTSVVTDLLYDDGFASLEDDDLRSYPGEKLWHDLGVSVDSEQLSSYERKIKMDKAKRDARLFSSMFHFAQRQRTGGRAGTCILVTSSRRLRGIGEQYGEVSDRTISLAAAMYILTVVPGVSLGLTALHSVLFDRDVLPRTSNLKTLVMRTVREAGYEVPSSRRQTLLRQVREGVLKVAREHGDESLKPRNIHHAIVTDMGESRTVLSKVLGRALQDIGALSPQEKEIDALRRENADLKSRLQAQAEPSPQSIKRASPKKRARSKN